MADNLAFFHWVANYCFGFSGSLWLQKRCEAHPFNTREHISWEESSPQSFNICLPHPFCPFNELCSHTVTYSPKCVFEPPAWYRMLSPTVMELTNVVPCHVIWHLAAHIWITGFISWREAALAAWWFSKVPMGVVCGTHQPPPTVALKALRHGSWWGGPFPWLSGYLWATPWCLWEELCSIARGHSWAKVDWELTNSCHASRPTTPPLCMVLCQQCSEGWAQHCYAGCTGVAQGYAIID